MALKSTDGSSAYCWRLLLTTVFLLLIPTAKPQGLGSCSLMEPYASDFLTLLSLDCAMDRSQCADSTSCQCQDDSPAFTTAAGTCIDGCTYYWGADPIQRSTSAGSFVKDNVGGIPIFQLVLGMKHTFDEFLATEQGSMNYFYYPGPAEEDAIFLPELGGSCSAELDGQDCACYQHYCDAEGTSYDNIIDCTGLEGGGVVDFCNPPLPLTEESTKMEILLFLPFVACSDPSQAMHSGGGNPPMEVSSTSGTGPNPAPLTDSSGDNDSSGGNPSPPIGEASPSPGTGPSPTPATDPNPASGTDSSGDSASFIGSLMTAIVFFLA